MSEYVPVPVAAARDIALNFSKDIVVIVALDKAHDKIHTTTYGRDAFDKILAADLGVKLALEAGCDVVRAEYNEDFRQPALRAQRIDELLAAAEEVRAGNHADLSRLHCAIENFKSGK
jgi:hypothetical protein